MPERFNSDAATVWSGQPVVCEVCGQAGVPVFVPTTGDWCLPTHQDGDHQCAGSLASASLAAVRQRVDPATTDLSAVPEAEGLTETDDGTLTP